MGIIQCRIFNKKIEMQKLLPLIACFGLFLAACNSSDTAVKSSAATSDSAGTAPNWKFGVALWTFHTFNFPQSLDKVDSAGIKYIEPNTFHNTGPELKDSLVLQLSPAGIDK